MSRNSIKKQVDKLLGIKKPFKMKLYKMNDEWYQVQMSENMFFEANINKDGTVNFHLYNTDFNKIKLGKRISLQRLYEDSKSTIKFDAKWIESFMKNIVLLQEEIVKYKRKKERNGNRKK